MEKMFLNSEIKLITGDCLDVFRTIPDSGVDLCFFDPPYNVGKDYGEYKDNLAPEEYMAWMTKVIAESKRIARRGIVVYVGGTLTRLFGNLIPDAHLVIVEKRAAGVISGNYVLQYHSVY